MKTLSVAQQFSRFPAGRYRSDGPHSGEEFRETVLAPALREDSVLVLLDGTMGYGSSFLEEAFSGLVRVSGFTRPDLEQRLTVRSTDKSLEDEVWQYIQYIWTPDSRPKAQ